MRRPHRKAAPPTPRRQYRVIMAAGQKSLSVVCTPPGSHRSHRRHHPAHLSGPTSSRASAEQAVRKIGVRRLDVLADVARELRVTLSDLLGEPVLLEDEDKHDDVPAIRDALMAPRRLSRTLFSSSVPPEYIDPARLRSARRTRDARVVGAGCGPRVLGGSAHGSGRRLNDLP